MSDVWHSAVVKHGCVSPRILWIKFKFSRVKVCVVVGYGPNEGDGEEREVCGSVRVWGKNPKCVWWNDEIKAVVRERRLLGSGYWQLAMKIQKKNVLKRTERRREKLKDA